MQRYNLNLKGGTYTQGDTYKALPILRQQVVPGQTVNIEADINLKTAAYLNNLTTPSMMSVWFFYVPHRLSWDGWTSFISKEEGAPSFPVISDPLHRVAPFFFEGNSDSTAAANGSPLFRRAYKLCYNEYFGTDFGGTYWYTDVNDDSVVTPYDTRNPEQFSSQLKIDDASIVDPEFTVTANAIPLNEFYRSMMNARSQQRSQMTGNKYVDTLARMGVDATWMVAERPEFLGTKSKLVAPQLTSNTTATESAFETARFSCNLSVNITNKHFAEHGYIVGIASVRPILMTSGRFPNDYRPTYQGPTDDDWVDSFYSADNLQTKDTYPRQLSNAVTPDQAFTERFSYLKKGEWLLGSGTTRWNANNQVVNFKDVIYPNSGLLQFSQELGGAQCAITTSHKISGKIPVGKSVA